MALPIFQRTVVNDSGDVISGAEVTVVNEATGLNASLFSDRAGTTPITNPFFTGPDGLAKFYATSGEYRITSSGVSGAVVWRYVALVGASAFGESASLPTNGGVILIKTEKEKVMFDSTGLAITTNQKITVNSVIINDLEPVSLPPLVPASDYLIYALADGTLEAKAQGVAPDSGSVQIGWFTTFYDSATINKYSLFDLNFRPKCDPRAMALSLDGLVCVDIYLVDVLYPLFMYSRPNQTIADGSNPPKVPEVYGGNGSAAYPFCDWFVALDIASGVGKRLPSYDEVTPFTRGVVENQSVGSDPIVTKYQAGHRSTVGIEQCTGAMRQFMKNVSTAATGAASWMGITNGRGNVFVNAIKVGMFGGAWSDGTNSGSRSSYWGVNLDSSGSDLGIRCVCDLSIL